MLQMEQKDYKFEIIEMLLRGDDHARSIASKLDTNHMMVSRKIKDLLKSNVVDLKKNGRNQTYFLKQSPEAKSFVLMAENYKLIKVLKKYPILLDIVNKIQKDKRIKLAILFGSYAKLSATKQSDIDLFISTKSKVLKKEYSAFDSKLNIKIGNYKSSSNLFREIDKNHVIIKGGDIYYEEFFG